MFSVGEKVRFVNNSDGKVKNLSLNNIYKIITTGMWKGKQTITVLNDWGWETSCYAERFELVKKKVKTYGIVRFWNKIETKLQDSLI